MKKINIFVVMFVIAVLLSIGVFSQLNPIINIVNKKSQITPTISLEEKETCTTKFYDEVQDVYGNCVYYHNYTDCLNTSGPNTDCSLQQDTWDFRCRIGEKVITKNKTDIRGRISLILA